MTEVVLDQARITALVRQRETCGVPHHMRVDMQRQACTAPDLSKEVIDRLAREWATFSEEEIRAVFELPIAQTGTNGAQFVTFQWLCSAEAALAPANVDTSCLKVYIRDSYVDQLRHAHPVAIGEQREAMVSRAMSAAPRGLEEFGNLRLGQEIPRLPVDCGELVLVHG
jgi:hypothetical protein